MARLKGDAGMKLIAEIVRAGPGRTPLYHYLRAHHDVFAALLDESRPDWGRLCDGFAKLGFLAADGSAIATGTARRTWWLVRRDVARSRGKRRPAPVPVVTVLAAPVMPATTPAAAPVNTDPPPPQSGNALARLRAEMLKRSGR